ncbi:MAG: bifunctional hydroxymethylpyrimidine kinase/phosphomethylpyrimidine kinase [Thermoanaerobaculia bacterium]|nr:bifunctional hydroxymethylpyrimidine kinase/phosphomethylpyrimidine kinase [Thermoanaerobaculia bacterium]
MSQPPRLLTIAGSDSGGGAGIQADLKTFAAHGAYGMSVITAVTAQDTRTVHSVHPIPADVVVQQIDAVFDDLGVDAVKIGMLADEDLVRAVAQRLRHHQPRHVVLDPVMVAKSGDALLSDSAVTALTEHLLPVATLVTPNLPEAERLTGLDLSAEEGFEEARAAAARLIAAMASQESQPAVLIKGGHGRQDEVVDLLFAGGQRFRWVHSRQRTSSTHGTGCTLSSAIAARLARGDDLPAAVGGAIGYLQGAIAAAFPMGGGHGPVNHLHRLLRTASGDP